MSSATPSAAASSEACSTETGCSDYQATCTCWSANHRALWPSLLACRHSDSMSGTKHLYKINCTVQVLTRVEEQTHQGCRDQDAAESLH